MIRINLLKPETKEIRETGPGAEPVVKPRRRTGGLGVLILLAALVGLGGYYYYQNKALDEERELLARAQQEKTRLQYVIQKLDEVQKQKTSLERKITLITQLKGQQDFVVRLMDTLSRTLPDWVWLTETSVGEKGIQIKGKALSNNLIADYIASLEASPILKNVNLIASTQSASGREQVLDFTLSAAVEKPEPAAPPAAAPPASQPARKTGRNS
jgi:type IV pilus assembly protein PilN